MNVIKNLLEDIKYFGRQVYHYYSLWYYNIQLRRIECDRSATSARVSSLMSENARTNATHITQREVLIATLNNRINEHDALIEHYRNFIESRENDPEWAEYELKQQTRRAGRKVR